MNYLYVHINGQDYVCVHEANEPVNLQSINEAQAVAYDTNQISIEQNRLNDHLESKGISTYSISIGNSPPQD